MDGVHLLRYGVWNGGGGVCGAGPSGRCARFGPCSASAVLISTAVMSCYCSLSGARCGAGECLSVGLCDGAPFVCSPLVVVVGGGIVDGGVALCGGVAW